MKVILDTNIFFSALISNAGLPHIIIMAWLDNQFDVVTTDEQLDEMVRVSRYPKFKNMVEPGRVGRIVNELKKSDVVRRFKVEDESKDPADAFLMTLARKSGADYLVTGDKKAGLLEMNNIGRTRIVTAATFCKEALRIYNH